MKIILQYNCGQTAGPHRVDLNVVPCWENGFTGKGVVVTIIDDGLDYDNKDLKKAYVSDHKICCTETFV